VTDFSNNPTAPNMSYTLYRYISRICRKAPSEPILAKFWHIERGGGRNHNHMCQFWCL